MTQKSTVQDWWAENPMTYGETHGKTGFGENELELGTKKFFHRLDEEFYSWNKPLHDKIPFDKLFPYEEFKGKRILEVGCGLGTMLMNWALNGAECTGVDLNPTSIAQTKKRFELLGLSGDIRLEDARKLPFADNSYDYVYSWGVLHHSPDIEASFSEFFRVLKPGGKFGIMLYNRHSLLQWYMTDYIEGILHNEKAFLSPLELNSRYGDGHREEGNPHTWPVTKREMHAMLVGHSNDLHIKTLGTDLDYAFRLMLPGLGMMLPSFLKKPWARRLGWSLWMTGTKKEI